MWDYLDVDFFYREHKNVTRKRYEIALLDLIPRCVQYKALLR